MQIQDAIGVFFFKEYYEVNLFSYHFLFWCTSNLRTIGVLLLKTNIFVDVNWHAYNQPLHLPIIIDILRTMQFKMILVIVTTGLWPITYVSVCSNCHSQQNSVILIVAYMNAIAIRLSRSRISDNFVFMVSKQ